MKPQDFYTRDSHNKGSRLQLKDQHGNLTDCYLNVIGQDSDKARNAVFEMAAKRASGEKLNSSNNAEKWAEYVIGWHGFEADYSHKVLVEMLKQAPYIQDQIILFHTETANFTNG